MSATSTGNSIFARARVLASQTGGDAVASSVIDSRGGIRALLNHSIREVYRRKAQDIKFRQDIVTTHTIAMTAGVGTLPEAIMSEFMGQAGIADSANSLISYMDFAQDVTGGQTFNQLGYLYTVGNEFRYQAPTSVGTYTGALLVTVPSFPTFPASMSDTITFPSSATIDDVVLFLSMAITGNEKYQVVSV